MMCGCSVKLLAAGMEFSALSSKVLGKSEKDVLERIKIVNSKEFRTLSGNYQFIGRELSQCLVRKSKDAVKGEYPMPSDRRKVDKGLIF